MAQGLILSLVPMVWSSLALAQTAPGGAPPPPTSIGGVHWLWIGIALIVAAVLVWQLMSRRAGPSDSTTRRED